MANPFIQEVAVVVPVVKDGKIDSEVQKYQVEKHLWCFAFTEGNATEQACVDAILQPMNSDGTRNQDPRLEQRYKIYDDPNRPGPDAAKQFATILREACLSALLDGSDPSVQALGKLLGQKLDGKSLDSVLRLLQPLADELAAAPAVPAASAALGQ